MLSHSSRGGMVMETWSSLRRLKSHMISEVVAATALYSASVDDLPTLLCILDSHDIGFGPRKKIKNMLMWKYGHQHFHPSLHRNKLLSCSGFMHELSKFVDGERDVRSSEVEILEGSNDFTICSGISGRKELSSKVERDQGASKEGYSQPLERNLPKSKCMIGKDTTEDLAFNPEIERTLRATRRAARLAKTQPEASTTQEEETLNTKSMAELIPPPPRRTMGDYCKKTDKICY
ncbi:hypothetical protein A2U01_0000858 [Trifolium medium]|uniref:Uncharacterized protein n=1 Tax=Trifolium medium TaxID=97028 RepID=A0A392LYQ9_9FABA|nr:hypothetical protein [Trifolium medium]